MLLHRKLCTSQPLGKRDAALGNMWLATAGDLRGCWPAEQQRGGGVLFVGYALLQELLQTGKVSRQL